MPHVVIIGAGLSGLSLAYRLRCARPDFTVTVLEKNSRTGGNIWTERRDGFQVEIGPNGFLDAKPSTMKLCSDLGLGEKLIHGSDASRLNRYLFWNGKLRPLPSSLWSFLTNGILSWRGKINLLMEKYRRRPPGTPDDESIHDFAKRRAGREVAEIIADAMVTGIHAGDPKLLSIQAAFPRVAKFERENGSVMRGFSQASRLRRLEAAKRGETAQPARMWSFRDGLRVLVEALQEQSGASIHRGVAVKNIRQIGPQWEVQGEGKDRWTADAVVLTCPAAEQTEQLSEVDPTLSEMIGSIRSTKVAVVALGFRQSDIPKPLEGFGYIAPQSTRRDVLGVQWCSSIFPGRSPNGTVLWRALCGGWHRGEMVEWGDDRLIAAVREELRLAQGVTAEPVFHHIARWPRAIPQYEIGHVERVSRIEQRLAGHRGLFLGGNAYHGVAMNDCTEQSEILAGRITQYLA